MANLAPFSATDALAVVATQQLSLRFEGRCPTHHDMNELQSRHCQACEGGAAALSEQELGEHLKRVEGWTRSRDLPAIERSFHFQSYPMVVGFANAVAWMAERENHHPILEVHYTHCVVRYYTHAIHGLSENDFICAAKANALYAL